jgi:hypothetical protein
MAICANGNDCNAHVLSGNAIYYNVLWGIHDESSLGNTHIGNQLSNGGHSVGVVYAASDQSNLHNFSHADQQLIHCERVLSVADTT